ncbi:MAG: hypothetical protein JRF40_02135 [Deltaproteobacteria bacterium]|nr:hypothetical protein [Deltaproteobacteria bacterium]MBW2218282.1 hypothetical protein [Deltaproteobacteria bacterium]
MKKTRNFILLFLVSLVYMAGLSSVCAKDFLEDYTKVKRQVPQHIVKKITANAEKKYPDNDRLKQYTVEIQKKAYFKVKDYKNDGLPSQELNLIVRNAERDKPYDYGSQLLAITKKVKEYIDSHK